VKIFEYIEIINNKGNEKIKEKEKVKKKKKIIY